MRFSTVKGAERKGGAKYTKERYKKMRCKTGMSTPKAASASLFPEPQNTRAPRPGVPKIFVGWCKVRRGAFEARLRRGSRKACPASSWACSMQPGYILKLGMPKICQREKTIVTGEDDRFICDAAGGCCNGSIDCRIFCADVGRRPLQDGAGTIRSAPLGSPEKKKPIQCWREIDVEPWGPRGPEWLSLSTYAWHPALDRRGHWNVHRWRCTCALDPDISRTCSDYRSWRTEGFGRRTPLQRLTQPNYEVNRSTR